MANPSTELDNFSAMLDWRFHEIWGIYDRGDRDEAEIAAGELLMEPRLSALHQAGLHLILAGSSFEYVEHAKESVRLHTEVKQKYQSTASSVQQANIQKFLDTAEAMLHKARIDQDEINRGVEKAIAGGMTMSDFHDARIKEALQAPRDRRGSELEPDLPSSPAARTTFPPSGQSAPETTMGDSRRTQGAGRSQSTALTDFDDDTSPLPEIRDFVPSGDDNA